MVILSRLWQGNPLIENVLAALQKSAAELGRNVFEALDAIPYSSKPLSSG